MKSLPGTRAPLRSPTFGLTPVSTTATITLLLPLLRSHASGILTLACGQERFQSASLGLIAMAEPAIARTPAPSNRRPTHFLTAAGFYALLRPLPRWNGQYLHLWRGSGREP